MSGCPTCSNWIAVTAIVLAIQFFPTACLAQEPLVAQDNSQHLALMQLVESLEPYHPKGEIKGSAVISGSTTMQSLARSWSERFCKFHPNVVFSKGKDGTESALQEIS